MSRSIAAVADEIAAIAPTGWAWPTEPDSTLALYWSPIAAALSDFEVADDVFFAEAVDPNRASLLLADYEADLGADPCHVDPSTLSATDRVAAMTARYFAAGQAISATTILAIAARFGSAVTVTEFATARMGVARMGGTFVPTPNQFAFRVTLPASRVTHPFMGAARAGDRFGQIATTVAECPIRQVVPAHTAAVFSYTGA